MTDAIQQQEVDHFFDAIEPTFRDAESHLGVSSGTVADIRHDIDFIAIVKMHATIEPLLNEALEKSLTRALKHPKVSFPGGEAIADFVVGANFEQKIRLSLKSELIVDNNARFIRAVAKLRNFYAHNVSNMPKSVYVAAGELDKQGDGLTILRDLMSYSVGKNKVTSRLAFVYLKPLMFFKFANLLGVLMDGIRPPPALSGAMFGILNQNDSSQATGE